MARKAVKKASSSKLPKWDLSDLFSGPEDRRIGASMRQAKKEAEAFRRKYAGKVAKQTRSAVAFIALLDDYQAIMLGASKPYHYASLLFAESAVVTGRGALLQKIRTQYVEIANILAFFSPELLSIEKKKLQTLAKHASLLEYRNYITQLIEYKSHELPEREKQIFSDLGLSGSTAVVRMFDEEFASRTYEIRKGKSLRKCNLEDSLECLHSADRTLRKAAHAGFSKGLEEDSRRLTLIYNTLLQDKGIRDRYHHFDAPEDSRHLENQISRKVTDSLVKAARQSYRDVAKFYEIKRELLGYKKLYDYDRYAPLGKTRKIPWDKARAMVIEAFTGFHPEFGRIAEMFFTKRWIDGEARPGKRGGAFCSFLTPDLHPYVFINYGGTERDVFTLAHELGHAIHAYLMREQTYLNFDTPLTIAETASVFSELVLFKSLIGNTRGEDAQLALTVHHLESVIATVHRQIAMFQFERDVHEARRHGEIQPQEMNAIWRARQEEMFRGSVVLTPEYDYWWSYIPHFMHTPFYVYAYSFGQLLALGLHEKYDANPDTFPEKYIEFLRSGNQKSPQELGKLIGINLARPEIWQDGVKSFRKMVRGLEKMVG